tara:strand:+ start:1352 stop:1582 length:231 start_codon:yes stop_codon:yes gene_type:complete
MITKEKIIEVFNYYAVGSFNIEITEDNLKLFAKEIEALSKVNNVVLDDVVKCDKCGSDDIYKGVEDDMCNNCNNFF